MSTTENQQILSRHDIELFIQCPRTFYLEYKLGVKRPPSYKATLDLAVKRLLKKEFDLHRVDKSKHPIMKDYGVEAIPFSHNDLGNWRETYNGLQTLHGPSKFIVSGRVDDVWHNPKGQLIVVEYKSATSEDKHQVDPHLEETFQRQIEIYQWILAQKGHEVSDKAYFIQCLGLTDREAFDTKLEFNLKLLEHTGDTSWVEPKLQEIRAVLDSDTLPQANPDSLWYNYYLGIKEAEAK